MSFGEWGVSEEIMAEVREMGIEVPTKIQFIGILVVVVTGEPWRLM